MAAFDSSLTYELFDPNLEATSVDRILRNTWTDSMNIKEKERKRALFLHCAEPRLQDIFDALEDTGVRF